MKNENMIKLATLKETNNNQQTKKEALCNGCTAVRSAKCKFYSIERR